MRFLFVCTGNTDRSPAAEAVMQEIAGGAHETRSAGTSPGSPRWLEAADIDWADVVAVMEDRHQRLIATRWPHALAKLRVLEIPDRYDRDDPALRIALESRLRDLLGSHGGIIER